MEALHFILVLLEWVSEKADHSGIWRRQWFWDHQRRDVWFYCNMELSVRQMFPLESSCRTITAPVKDRVLNVFYQCSYTLPFSILQSTDIIQTYIQYNKLPFPGFIVTFSDNITVWRNGATTFSCSSWHWPHLIITFVDWRLYTPHSLLLEAGYIEFVFVFVRSVCISLSSGLCRLPLPRRSSVGKWPVSHLKAVPLRRMMNPSYVFDVVHESSLRVDFCDCNRSPFPLPHLCT